MISAIDTALQQIHFNINDRILQLAFPRSINMSLDSHLKSFISSQILPQCNLKGGKMLPITLHPSWGTAIANSIGISLFEIPFEARDGREIIEVGEVSYRPTMGNGYGTGYANTSGMYAECNTQQGPVHELSTYAGGVMNSAMAMVRSKVGAGMDTGAPIAEIVGGNMIKLHPATATFVPWTVYCRLAYDSELTNLNSGAIINFAEVVVTGLKIYCHTKIMYDIDLGQIEYGTPLEAIRERISSWGDLQDRFKEQLNRFSGSTVLDIHRITNLIRDAL